LCFSVRPGTPQPPSLANIFKERLADLGLPRPDHGYLMAWAQRGALLLNSVLTVEAGRAAAHQKRGWETFTDRAIEALSAEREGIAFVLWGAYAQQKGRVIDRRRHFVHEGPHPSPLSASRGFFGSRPFSKINAYFASRHEPPFDWSLPTLAEIRTQA
jgi:uracil-DNA glycosylase